MYMLTYIDTSFEVYTYKDIHIHMYTYTHTHVYIYIYIPKCLEEVPDVGAESPIRFN
jgi:hypothetical protein